MVAPVATLASRLRRLMRERGAQTKQIAVACGVSPQTVHNWLSGSMPKPKRLATLAKYLEVSEHYLLDGVATPARQADEAALRAVADELAALLPDDELRGLLITLRRLRGT